MVVVVVVGEERWLLWWRDEEGRGEEEGWVKPAGELRIGGIKSWNT